MTWMSFTATLIQALAWPVTVLTIFFLLRRHITGLLPRVRQLKYKDVEISFGERVRELAAEASETLPALIEPAGLPQGERSHLETLAELSPRAAVLEAWIPVERAALQLAIHKRVKLSRDARASARGVAEALLAAGVIPEEEAHLFEALRTLRNQAAHAEEFVPPDDAATDYIEVAQRLVTALRSHNDA